MDFFHPDFCKQLVNTKSELLNAVIKHKGDITQWYKTMY